MSVPDSDATGTSSWVTVSPSSWARGRLIIRVAGARVQSGAGVHRFDCDADAAVTCSKANSPPSPQEVTVRPTRACPSGRRLAPIATILLLAACADTPTDPLSGAAEPVSAPAAALVTAAVPPFVGCTVNTLASGALYQLCFPPTWNGDVVYWAHGYVDPSEPVQLPNDAIGGTPVAAIVTGLGYGYATTSYRANGLIADKAVDDLNLLAATVAGIAPQHGLDLLVGASEGGLSTMLAMEQGGSLFEGGLSTCGPVGSFRGQIDYLGDFRVVFDYFFPNVIPGSAISIPPAVIANWESVYVPTILATLQANPAKTQQLLKVTRAPIDAADPTTIGQTVIGLLWYNVHGTNDAVARLGGNPFDNRSRLYFG
jgi:hypothetical protein